jgi:hypothetical protein
MRDERGSWYLLTALVVGLGMGLLYAWIFAPIQYVDTSPVSLREDFKSAYRVVIAAAYAATGDLQRAKARLNLLEDSDPSQRLAAQAQRTLAEGRRYEDAQALALLASALGEAPTPLAISTQPPLGSTTTPTSVPIRTATPSPEPTSLPTHTLTPTLEITASETLTSTQVLTSTPTRRPRASRTPSPTITPLPTRTATPTLGPPFVLDEQNQICDPAIGESQIQVLVTDASGNNVPGVEIIIQWDDQEENFFTGLKPEFGLGYADFTMTPGVIYTLHIAEGGQLIQDLTALECSTTSGERYWGSWRLTFTQP